MHPISAIIVVKDNPPHLFETLDSIKDFVKEILIVDIGITDETKKQLSTYQIKLIKIQESVPYVELIREKVKQEATQPYVLFLDPDEITPPDLITDWEKYYYQYDYIVTPRKNIIFGKWIRYSRWWPDYQIRLFKKDAVIWPTQIHKQPKTSGVGYTIPENEHTAILHNNYASIDEYLNKMIRYAKSESMDYINQNKTLVLSDTLKTAISEFISRFFAYEGYKDGMHGFTLALLQMFYCFLVYFYWWEGKKYPVHDQKILIEETQTFFSDGLFETQYWLRKKNLKKIGLKEKLIGKLLRLK